MNNTPMHARPTNLRVGMPVLFGRPNGEKTMGEVVKINAASVKVKQTEPRNGRPSGTIWRVAPSLVFPLSEGSVLTAPAKVAASPVAPPTTPRPEADILRDIQRVYNSMSPENLSCDGELSRTEVRIRFRHLDRKLKALFIEIGREVHEEEAFRG